MGFLDSIKAAAKEHTGLGVNGIEQYSRAYTQGIFKQDYGEAIKIFTKAEKLLIQEGNAEMAKRAKANAVLYALVSSLDRSLLPNVINCLSAITEIERIGTQQEMIPAEPLAMELTAINTECQINSSMTDEEKKDTYKAASVSLEKCPNAELQFIEKLKLPGPSDKAINRIYYYTGLSDFHAGLTVMDDSPTQAQDLFQRAESYFEQAHVEDWKMRLKKLLADISIKRHCWMCGRENQGQDIFFKEYPANIKNYHHHIVKELQQDEKMLGTNSLTLCTACGSTIEEQSDLYATTRMNEVRVWAQEIFNEHTQVLNQHAEHIAQNERDISALESQISRLSSAISSISR